MTFNTSAATSERNQESPPPPSDVAVPLSTWHTVCHKRRTIACPDCRAEMEENRDRLHRILVARGLIVDRASHLGSKVGR